VSSRRGALGALLALALAASAGGCNSFGIKLPPGMEACVAAPAAICGEVLQSRKNERAPVALSAYRISCTVDQCTEAAGSVEVVLNWADGRSETSSYTWAAAGS
jgi:hypothetical protein